jgi:lipopolysaccharide transport system ATP-binding protein
MSALVAKTVGKRFRHRDAARARTVHQFLEGGWRQPARSQDFWALRNVSLSVEAGEMFGVIGRNGAGKSTLLRLLGGVMQPDEGRVVARDQVKGLLDLNAGMHPDLTGRENATCSGVIAGLTRRQVLAQMDEVIAFAELEDFIDDPVRTYSAGMKLRLGFAVAAQTTPRILLIDEVLAVGDIAFQRKCMDRINLFRAQGCAIILISHDLAQVEAMCDRTLWLRNGQVASIGATRNVIAEYGAEMLQETLARTPTPTPEIGREGANLVLGVNRFGSQQNQIVNFRLLDALGRPAATLKSGDSFALEIEVDGQVPLDQLQASATMSNAHGTVLDFNTQQDAVALPSVTGTTRLRLEVGPMELAPGRHFFSVGLYEKAWAFAYDRHVTAYEVEVEGEENPSSQDIPHRWAVVD